MTTTYQPTSTPNRFSVLVDGAKIGEVFKAATTTTVIDKDRGSSRGHSVGRQSTRTTWGWDNGDFSDTGFTSRKAAVEDMLCF
jgi:hypothetical protein